MVSEIGRNGVDDNNALIIFKIKKIIIIIINTINGKIVPTKNI